MLTLSIITTTIIGVMTFLCLIVVVISLRDKIHKHAIMAGLASLLGAVVLITLLIPGLIAETKQMPDGIVYLLDSKHEVDDDIYCGSYTSDGCGIITIDNYWTKPVGALWISLNWEYHDQLICVPSYDYRIKEIER